MSLVRHTAPQGSPEWHLARCGVCTASTFKTAISVLTRASGDKKAGESTNMSDELAAVLAVERISGVPYRAMFDSEWTAEGKAQEPEARMAYELATGYMVTEAGVLVTEDRRFGYSTDGEVVGNPGLLEVKTLVSARRIAQFIANPTEVVADFADQCNGGLWLTGLQWIDLLIWIPQLRNIGRHYNVIRIHRDEAAIDTLEQKLWAFVRRVDAIEASMRASALPMAA